MTDPLRLNLGSGKHPMEGWVNVDQHPDADLHCDLDTPSGPWVHNAMRAGFAYADSMVDEVYGSHVIEHIRHVLPLMQELWRVTRADGLATFATPYGSSDDAWANPTHVRPMFVESWAFFGQPNYWREDYGYRGDWVVEEVRLRVTADQWKQADENPTYLWHRVQSWRNVVREMVATLRCNKPARVPDRDLQEDKTIIIEVLEPVDGWTNMPREVGRLVMGQKRG